MLADDLSGLQKNVFDACGTKISQLKAEVESAEYCAMGFRLNQFLAQYRSAKITPTKLGQFVTLWKRDSPKQPIRPYHVDDQLDLAIIATRQDEKLGYFIFPVAVMSEQGIVGNNKNPGKRGFRLYPAWDKPVSKQAVKSQKWQLQYFLEMTDDIDSNVKRCQQLLSL